MRSRMTRMPDNVITASEAILKLHSPLFTLHSVFSGKALTPLHNEAKLTMSGECGYRAPHPPQAGPLPLKGKADTLSLIGIHLPISSAINSSLLTAVKPLPIALKTKKPARTWTLMSDPGVDPYGGERGIRTLDTLRYTRSPGERVRPDYAISPKDKIYFTPYSCFLQQKRRFS